MSQWFPVQTLPPSLPLSLSQVTAFPGWSDKIVVCRKLGYSGSYSCKWLSYFLLVCSSQRKCLIVVGSFYRHILSCLLLTLGLPFLFFSLFLSHNARLTRSNGPGLLDLAWLTLTCRRIRLFRLFQVVFVVKD